MKNLITSLALCIMGLGFSQSAAVAIENEPIVEDVKITIEVESAEELQDAFKIEDAEELLEMSTADSDISVKIVCNGRMMSNGEKSHMSYTVKGNKKNAGTFLESVEKIRTSAIAYYNNKN